MAEKKKSGPGRKRLCSDEPTVYVGMKCPSSVNEALLAAVESLKLMGFNEIDKSKLVRALVCYRIANATVIYKELMRNG